MKRETTSPENNVGESFACLGFTFLPRQPMRSVEGWQVTQEQSAWESSILSPRLLCFNAMRKAVCRGRVGESAPKP